MKLENIIKKAKRGAEILALGTFLALPVFGCKKGGGGSPPIIPPPQNQNPVITSNMKTSTNEGDNFFDRVIATDPENDNLTYLWSFDSKPALSSLTDNDILNRNSAYPSFVPDAEDTSVPYTLKLVVSDGRGLSDNAYFSILAVNNSPPIANAGNILGVPKNITFSIDATNSSDIYDGVITQYELDLEGDGTYEASNTSGTFNILGGYPLDICLYSTIKLRDDDNAQDIAIDCIPVGIGVCPDPCP